MTAKATALEDDIPWEELDPGIRPVVVVLRKAGLNTVSSCQGGHAYKNELPWVVIVPRRGEIPDVLRRKAAQALTKAGYHGFGILAGMEWWYQKTATPWHTQPYNGKPHLRIQFWNKVG